MCPVSECVESITLSAENSKGFLLRDPHYEFYSESEPNIQLNKNSNTTDEISIDVSKFRPGNGLSFLFYKLCNC